MPPVNVLIKPASSACNMRCAYCFYRDVSEHREQAFTGMLPPERMEKIICAAVESAEGSCTFAFQGGEPTLAGLDFFRQVVQLEEKHAKPGVTMQNTIQTNGLGITEEWAAFLSQNHFLVGLSLDGPGEIHDRNRVDVQGEGTFAPIMETVKLFDRYGVEYNILCVVTGRNARSIGKIYHFFKKHNFGWLQFIPCMEPLDGERGGTPFHLSPEQYGDFLVRLFDLWYADLCQGTYVSIRHLDNWLGILLGQPPEACNMAGHCSVQFVVEGDGGVYPCDFYATDRWRLGTVGEQSFAVMAQGERAAEFVKASFAVPAECRACPVYALCRNGCRRDRAEKDGVPGKNYYCEAYRRFFWERNRELVRAARIILRMRGGR